MPCINSKNKSIQVSLNLIGVPLAAGVFAALVATIAFITATTPQWMVGVTKALETEEKASLQRLSVAQAAYSEEIMGQMITETNMMTEYALQIFMTDGYTSSNVNSVNSQTNLNPTYNFTKNIVQQNEASLPSGTWMWGYPFSNQNNILEVGTPNGRSAGDIVAESSQCTSTFKTNCWTEPLGGDNTVLRDGSKGNTKSSMVMWPPQLGLNVQNLPKKLMEEVRITGYLTNVMSEVYFSNPTAVSVYIGTERNGIMRQFPYAHQTVGLSKKRFTAASTPPFSTDGGEEYYGYDPRKRPWYAEAKYKKELIVSAPYVYSTPPFPIGITIAKPILHPVTGELFGVIGFDVTVSLLEKVILSSSILYNGYAYLVNTEGRSVVYPCSKFNEEQCNTHHRCKWENKNCKTPDNSYYSNLEFDTTSDTGGSMGRKNLKTFNEDLWNTKMKVLKTGVGTYYKYSNEQKNNTLWHIAYAPVKISNYILALVVPDEDIQLPATRVSNSISAGITAQVLTYIIVTAIGLVFFLFILRRVSVGVVRPVNALKGVIDLIINDLNRQKENDKNGGENVTQFQLNINELLKEEDEMCKEVSMMKQSFEYMVRALRVGKSAFARNDLNGAEKVYQDALTMYTNLKNAKGIGISNFNLGATSHRRWLSDKVKHAKSFDDARHYYELAITIAREQWSALNQSDSEGQWSRNNSTNDTVIEQGTGKHSITVNIEMVEQKTRINSTTIKPRRVSAAPGQKNDATVKGVSLGASGHDIADRLSGRLYQLGQLYFDVGTVDACRAAEPLIQEALVIDEQTNNVLGYATRVGLLCKIMVILNKFAEANERIKEQLAILRQRLIKQEDRDDESNPDAIACSDSERNREQERDELFQALQHCLKDAAIIQGCSMGDDHLAMRYFIESLSCAPRSEPFVLNSIFRELDMMLSDSNCRLVLPNHLKLMIDQEVSKRCATMQLPKDVAFVIDYSGSMSGGKMRRARNNTIMLMDSQLNENDRASIIRFNSKVTILTELLPATDSRIKQAIHGMTNPNSGTALWDAIGAAHDQLTYAQQRNGGQERESWIIAVTDGADNRSEVNTPSSLYHRIKSTMPCNIIILAVGVSEDCAQIAMKQVADANEHNDDLIGELIAINDSAALDAAFATIASMIGDHVRVEQH